MEKYFSEQIDEFSRGILKCCVVWCIVGDKDKASLKSKYIYKSYLHLQLTHLKTLYRMFLAYDKLIIRNHKSIHEIGWRKLKGANCRHC